MTPSDIKYEYESKGRELNDPRYFFERKTMKWFGDTMRSFGTREIDGVRYLYRKPDARVNVFGTWKTAGREFFNAWRFDPVTGDLHYCNDEETAKVFACVY